MSKTRRLAGNRVFLVILSFWMGEAALAESGSFEFRNWNGPALNVQLHVPDIDAPDTPVVIVMHGWSREAQRYFNDWRMLGEANGFVVVVPHFTVEDFPSSNDYNQGGVFDAASGALRPETEWTFSAIEPLFDAVVERIGGNQEHYTLYGHSAGSQFVHRFLYYKPHARVKRFIAANAGWYTMPDFDTAYPYGLGNAEISEGQLAVALEKDVVLLLGREDVNHEDPVLRNTGEARRQGKNRFARGLTMFYVATQAADELEADFAWRLATVEGAGHSNAEMAPAAAAFVE